MWFKTILTACLGIATATSAIGLHKATDGLLQVTPSFSSDGILLHPGLHPDHDSGDLKHLIPGVERVLHYSQEGHRAALHGSKHASLEAKFVRGTVVLDHSDHIKSVTCDNNDMHVCFKTPKAFNVVEHSWGSQENFNLATYHVGCGDESSGKRSFFHASKPSVNSEDMCVVIPVTPIDESEALHSGVMSWGTYTDPNERRRSPVKGHVRVANPNTNGTKPMSSGRNMDIATDPSALKTFFNNSHIDTSNMGQLAPSIDFMSTEDPEIPEKPTNNTGRLSARSRALRTKRTMAEISERSSSELARRDILKGLLRGLQWLGRKIASFFTTVGGFIKQAGDALVELAVISAKLLLVPFGVPFDHTYHHDIYFDQHLDGAKVTNKPPKIFDFGNGFTLAQSFSENIQAVDWTLQCAKCGVHVNIDIAGRLAFSIKDGITEGTLTLTNKDALTLDAVFGISGDVKINQSNEKKKRLNKQEKNLQSYPAGVALYIPGILTLGPQLSFGAAFSLEAEGKFELLLGGSVSVGKGTASVSLKGGRNGATGFEPKFKPVLRFKGSATLTGEIGVPMAIEVGINVLSGKFKKTAGLVNTPSVYVQTGLSIDEQKTQNTPVLCPNGISLKVGAKNRIHLSGFDIWEYELSSIPIFERLITCVTTNGIKSDVVLPGLVETVVTEMGGDSTAGNPHIAQVPDRTPKHNSTQGFRILMDGKSDTILVSGSDGGLYLVGKNQGYDVSAPWGTLDKEENPLALDVFGRILSYLPLPASDESLRSRTGLELWAAKNKPILADLMVSQPHQVPPLYKSTAIKELKSGNPHESKRYGIPLVLEIPNLLDSKIQHASSSMYYPTACKTPSGLKVIATREIITKDGEVKSLWHRWGHYRDEMASQLKEHYNLRIKDCRTIQLVTAKSQ